MVYRIPEVKPSLKGGGSPVDASEHRPALAYDSNSEIIMFSEESWLSIAGSWLKTSGLFLLSAMMIFLVIYVTLAASLLFATPVNGKVTVVARDTFLGGVPSQGEVVLASPTQAAGKNPLDRLKEAALGVSKAETVTILSGPTDTLQIDDSSVSVSGGKKPGTYRGTVLDPMNQKVTGTVQLNNQYLGQCDTGCTPGTYVIVPDTNIFGKVVDFGASK